MLNYQRVHCEALASNQRPRSCWMLGAAANFAARLVLRPAAISRSARHIIWTSKAGYVLKKNCSKSAGFVFNLDPHPQPSTAIHSPLAQPSPCALAAQGRMTAALCLVPRVTASARGRRLVVIDEGRLLPCSSQAAVSPKWQRPGDIFVLVPLQALYT